MNERMLELAKQAEWSANRGDDVDVVVMMEKFGELIVRECIRKIDDMVNDGWYADTDRLKQHFGVEE